MPFFSEAFQFLHSYCHADADVIALIGPAGWGKSTYAKKIVIDLMKEQKPYDVITVRGADLDTPKSLDKFHCLLEKYHSATANLIIVVDDAHLLRNADVLESHLQQRDKRIHVILQSQVLTDTLRAFHEKTNSAYFYLNHHDFGSYSIKYANEPLPSKPRLENKSVQCDDLEGEPKWTLAYRAQLRRQRELRGPTFLTGMTSLSLSPREKDEIFLDASEEREVFEEEDATEMNDNDSERTFTTDFREGEVSEHEEDWANDKVSPPFFFTAFADTLFTIVVELQRTIPTQHPQFMERRRRDKSLVGFVVLGNGFEERQRSQDFEDRIDQSMNFFFVLTPILAIPICQLQR